MIEFDPIDFSPANVSHDLDLSDERIRFKFRARTTGTKEYICVFCGWNNRFQITHTTVTNRCHNDLCRRMMGFGDVGYILPRNGVRTAAPDLVIPRNLLEAYPDGDLARWKNGQEIHRVAVLVWPE